MFILTEKNVNKAKLWKKNVSETKEQTLDQGRMRNILVFCFEKNGKKCQKKSNFRLKSKNMKNSKILNYKKKIIMFQNHCNNNSRL